MYMYGHVIYHLVIILPSMPTKSMRLLPHKEDKENRGPSKVSSITVASPSDGIGGAGFSSIAEGEDYESDGV